jgi:hypothetical protein
MTVFDRWIDKPLLAQRSVTDGSIIYHQTKEMSKQTFLVRADLIVKNFELRLEYRSASPQGNSGIQLARAS